MLAHFPVFSSMRRVGRGGHCLGGCNNEAWAIFIEIEVAHARLIYEFKLSKIVEHERNVIPIFIN